ncbi:MAG: FAD-binding oxidoreductase, partial [Acidimicrobiales bacterium]
MTEPTPVTPLDTGGGPAAEHLAGPRVLVDEHLATRLAGVCSSVTRSDDVRSEAGRDWWPLAIGWATSGEVPALPAVVARPTTVSEVAAVLAVCNEARVPVTATGGRSGVCGAAVPVFGGVSLDLVGLEGIGDVDETSLLARIGAGTFGPDVEDGLRAHGLTLGHWPQSMALSTVGGWVACRGAGQYSTRYGKIEDMVVGLEVVLADGTVVPVGGHGPRAATGPDLTQLFVGSEGTLGVVTEATLRLHPVPTGQARRAFGFTSFAAGLDACRRMLARGATPAVLRLYDATESGRSFDHGETNVLVVLDEADPVLVDATMAVVDDECRRADRLDDTLVERWLAQRNDVSALAPLWRAGVVVDTVEVAGRWSVLPGLYHDVLRALESVEGTLVASSHQSHAYPDGACLYFTFAGRQPSDDDSVPGASSPSGSPSGGPSGSPSGTGAPPSPTAATRSWGEAYYRAAWDAVTTTTLAAGAAISHHHGIGLNRARFLPAALGAGFGVLQSMKDALDPHGILNPGKLG